MARNLDEPGANFNQLLELSIKLENARTFADASTEMEQYPDTYLRPGETLEDWTGHYFRKPNAAGGRIYGKYAQQLASGGPVEVPTVPWPMQTFAGGGMVGIRRPSALPPTRGPQSQGLASTPEYDTYSKEYKWQI